MDHLSDQQLVDAINGGDTRAFDALYFRYRDWVVRLATRFTGNPDDAVAPNANGPSPYSVLGGVGNGMV